MPILAVFDTKK